MTDYIAAIESVFKQFGIEAVVVDTTVGPSVTRYEVMLGDGVKVEKVAGLQKQFAYATAAQSVRVLAPIPGKSAVGIELPNDKRETVKLFKPDDDHPLTVAVGKTVDGELLSANLGKMPHLLVAGTTGSGKSSFINAMLVSLLTRRPEQVQLLLIDPKMVELTPYEGVPHLVRPVVTEVDEAIEALNALVEEMEKRYRVMRQAGVRHIDGLGYPYLVCVVDELADLMMAAPKEIESAVVRIAQKARAAGIHLVLATQRPSVDVVTGLIKANVPSRLAFAVRSQIDSRIILDECGAEQLLGMGDALLLCTGARNVTRVQGVLVTSNEIETAVQAWQNSARHGTARHGTVRRGEARQGTARQTTTPERRIPRGKPRRAQPVIEPPKVETQPESAILGELIDYAREAIEKIDRFLIKASGRQRHEDKMMTYCDAPLELSRSAIALGYMVHGLEMIQDGGRPNVKEFYRPGRAA